ncbi:MAG: sulfatase-like hydrolase/transferase, partial [Blastocatellia bacterium]
MRSKLKRRDFLKTGALSGAGALSASIFRRHSGLASTAASGPPNIILIIVDELRYPMTFPGRIKTADEFLAKYMPNLYNSLWTEGVKFSRYYTAASDCTPSRGIIATGLHAHQTNMLTTRAPFFAQNLPELDPDFPTYGKLLRELGYETPYIGKWHLSDSPASPHAPGASEYLQPYGFQGLTMPDPLGLPGQGIGASLPLGPLQSGDLPIGDAEIATQAVRWLGRRASGSGSKPFCLTVSFINPHDKQFFWAGIDVKRFKE